MAQCETCGDNAHGTSERQNWFRVAGARQRAESPGIKYLYASELIDGDTCDACRKVDGTRYATIDEALIDYPGFGPFAHCAGTRCRGTAVSVSATEAEPTLESPGDV